MSYVAPEFYKDLFTCPHCLALSHMSWDALRIHGSPVVYTSRCTCDAFTYWIPHGDYSTLFNRYQRGQIVYPLTSVAPLAEPDMPPEIRIDFEEARLVFNHSPRAAAALLRLCVQKLCQTLLGKEGKIHNQIGELVELGFPKRALTAFDTIRIFGNESVHPGTVDLNDTPDVALALFRLLNMAVRHCITEENELKSIRALTPVEKRREIGE